MSRISGIIGRIISIITGRRQQPPSRWRWAYRCYWVDVNTGDELATSYHVVTTASDRNYQEASGQARREAMADPPLCIARMQRGGRGIRLRCERVGDPVPLP